MPEEHAARYQPGEDYGRHLIASGPYRLKRYTPGRVIELVRNENWDPRTDPLRSAWVDKVSVTIGRSETEIQQAIEDEVADLNLDAVPPPVGDLQRLSDDPALARRLAVETTGCVHYLTLQMDAGPTRSLAVRQAVNYAIDRQAVVLAIGGRYAGEPATTVLSPTLAGHSAFDLYPSQDATGDPDKARELLAEAGYPDGVRADLRRPVVGEVEGPVRGAAVVAGPGRDPARADLLRRARRLPEVAAPAVQARRAPPGRGPGLPRRPRQRQPLDHRRPPRRPHHHRRPPTTTTAAYNNAKVNALIDQAYGTRDDQARTALWGQIDRLVMEDAAWAPLVYDREAFFWSSRVRNWTFTPWLANPDITNLWLDPNTP